MDLHNAPGCPHYRRRVKLVTPCCDKLYTCRQCHDNAEPHTLDTAAVTELVCYVCDTRQPVQDKCQTCQCIFGAYTCLICKLFDDDDHQGQFHCDGCGICRVGGRERSFHCTTCDMCVYAEFANSHECVENLSGRDCPICQEPLRTSRNTFRVLACGHPVHVACLYVWRYKGTNTCPLCRRPLSPATPPAGHVE